MDAQNIINSLNTVSQKLFKSLDDEIFEKMDDLVNVNSDLFNKSPLKDVFFQDKTNALIIIANSLILFYVIYFVFLKLISIYNGNKSQSIYMFVIKLIIVTVMVNFSYYICREIVNMIGLLTDCVDGGLYDLLGKKVSFVSLKENIVKIDDIINSDLLSLNGIIKGIISFGSISILINFAIRYVTIIFLFIISPFAFICLSNELTIGIFRTWFKTLFVSLMTQIIVKFIIFIPLLYKDINSMTYKIILVGSIYIIYKINGFTKEIFMKISSNNQINNIFNRKNKWMGIIDYKSLLVLVIYMFIIFSAIRVLNLSLKLSMYLFLFFTVPIISAVIINVNNEVAIDVILIIIKFYIKKKIFINKKEIKKEKIKLYKKHE